MNNFRDIGYGKVKKGLLFRGCEISEATPEDKALLKANGIRTIIDLRSVQEVEEAKDAEVPGIKIINVPLLSIEEMSVMVEGQFPDVRASYRASVGKGKKEVWTKIFDVLLNADEVIMFHCTQGKDRTGIVAAVILASLGADKETIFHDYLKTNEFASMPEEYRAYGERLPEDFRKLFAGLFLVDKDFLAIAFEEIDKEYGSFDGFLAECCSLDSNKIALLKEKYLTM